MRSSGAVSPARAQPHARHERPCGPNVCPCLSCHERRGALQAERDVVLQSPALMCPCAEALSPCDWLGLKSAGRATGQSSTADGSGHTSRYMRLCTSAQRQRPYLVVLTPVDVGPPGESSRVEHVCRLYLHANSSTSVNTTDQACKAGCERMIQRVPCAGCQSRGDTPRRNVEHARHRSNRATAGGDSPAPALQ